MRNSWILVCFAIFVVAVQINAWAADLNVFRPESYGSNVGTGQDDTSAIQAAINAAQSVCGQVVLTGRYLQNSANITIPNCVQFTGTNAYYPGAKYNNNDYSKTLGTLVQNPSYTLLTGNNVRVARLIFLNKNWSPLTSFRGLVNMITGFSGVAVTLQPNDAGSDSRFEDLQILGYQTGISDIGNSRDWFFNSLIDSQECIHIDGSYDIAGIVGAECFPALTYNTTWSFVTWPISGVSQVSGGVQLTIGTPTVSSATLLTGDTVNVYGIGNLPGLNGHYILTVTNSTTVTLQGATLSPAVTGTTKSASSTVAVSSVANIGVGQTVSGSGIPSGTTVINVVVPGSQIVMSNAATLTASNVALTVTSPSYSGSGTLSYEALRRTGAGLTIAHSQSLTVDRMFVLGHDVGFHEADGAQGVQFVNARTDNDPNTDDRSTIGYLEDNALTPPQTAPLPVWSYWIGGELSSQFTSVSINDTVAFSAATSFTGTSMNPANNDGYMVSVQSGRANIVASQIEGNAGSIYAGDNATYLGFTSPYWYNTPPILLQSLADDINVHLDPQTQMLYPSSGPNFASGISATQLSIFQQNGAGASLGRLSTSSSALRVQGRNVALGAGSSLVPSATSGFVSIPGVSGAPTGTPILATAGDVPMAIDTTNLKLCFYISSSWKCMATPLQ